MSREAEQLPFSHIVGCPRSGTYLFAVHLEAAFGVAIPVETQIAPGLARLARVKRRLDTPRQRRALARAAQDFWGLLYGRGLNLRESERVASASLSAVVQAIDIAEIETPGAFLRALYAGYAKANGVALSGDKTAFYDPIDPDRYLSVLPSNTRIIHVIRDPRDACPSWRREWFGPPTLTESALLWRRHIRTHRRWGERHPGRYLEIRFEDFLNNPDETMNAVGSFLELQHTASCTGTGPLGPSARAIGGEPTHGKLLQAIDPQNAGKWRKDMSDGDRRLVESIAGREMAALGYPLSAGSGAADAVVRAPVVRIACAWIRRYLSPNLWRRRIRDWLPMILYVRRLIWPS